VSECDRETSVMRTPWPTMGCCTVDFVIIIIIMLLVYYILLNFGPLISRTLACLLRVNWLLTEAKKRFFHLSSFAQLN